MVSMCKEKKAYIQPSVELYAVTHILLDGSQWRGRRPLY